MNPIFVLSLPLLLASPTQLLTQLLGLGGSTLAQAVLVAISLLAAFLTVVQVWQIPAPSRRISGVDQLAVESATPLTVQPDQPKDFALNLLSNNFSRTVLGGLVGLTAVTFLESLFKTQTGGLDAKAYYVVLFTAFFLAFLFISAVFRGLVEAGRSRLVLSRPVAPWPPPISREGGMSLSLRFQRWLGFWLRRIWYWIASFRAPILVFADTFFNVIQGKNQLKAAALSDTVIDLHEALVEAAERVRDEVHRAVIQALVRRNELQVDLPHEECVRVAVSLLSSDETRVYYVSRERGSLSKDFHRDSLAWIAAFASVARWCKSGLHEDGPQHLSWNDIYAGNPLAIAFDNERGGIPAQPKKLPLQQYYESRGPEDYKAFVVLPMPWTHRGTAGIHRRGAIHISFKDASHMDALWAHLERKEKDHWLPNYEGCKGILETREQHHKNPGAPPLLEWCGPNELRSRLNDARKERPDQDWEKKELLREIAELGNASQRLQDRAMNLQMHFKPSGQETAPPIFLRDRELCSVLHQALETLGEALAHFDDEVFEEYVQLRRHD